MSKGISLAGLSVNGGLLLPLLVVQVLFMLLASLLSLPPLPFSLVSHVLKVIRIVFFLLLQRPIFHSILILLVSDLLGQYVVSLIDVLFDFVVLPLQVLYSLHLVSVLESIL